MREQLRILDICGGSGEWSRPYAEAGYQTIIIDPAASCVGRRCTAVAKTTAQAWSALGQLHGFGPIHGILCAPPCTEFAVSGARWWAEKPPEKLAEAVAIVRACLEIVRLAKPTFWALENPVGRIRACVPELGPPLLSFDPADYGDDYTKRTLLWGRFKPPFKQKRDVSGGSRMHRLPPSEDRAALRSVTPAGFARAFFEANP